MISLTMSRISSRAEFGVELGELGEVDGLDQRAEDRALGLVIGLGVPRVGRRWARAAAKARREPRALARRRRGNERRTKAGRRNRRAAALHDRRRARQPVGAASLRGRRRAPALRAAARPLPARRLVCRLPNWNAYRTRTELRADVRPTASSACSSNGLKQARLAPFSSPFARSAVARAGGTISAVRWRRTTAPRSSGRCWRPCRKSAARTG